MTGGTWGTGAAPERLLVLGAGTMGSQIAQLAALAGVAVRLVDRDGAQLTRALAQNHGLLERRVAAGRLDAAAADAALARVEVGDDLATAAQDCRWAVEAIVEDVARKREAFAALDVHLPPGAGIATNSSTIVVGRLAGATARPGLCCNMHFFHPALVLDLCEVAGGPETETATLERAEAWAARLGRTTIRVSGESDGFVVNRILGAAYAEAFALVAEGVADPADVDHAARAGLNWRLGPFELADSIGIDVVLGVRRDRLARRADPRDRVSVGLLERMVAAGRLGRKTGRGFYDYAGETPVPLALPA